MKKAVAMLLVLLVGAFALGQDAPKKSKARRTVVVRGVQFPSRLDIVVDASGSMFGLKFARAVTEARRIASSFTDAGHVRFHAFADNLTTEPQGWIALPDATAVTKATLFLAGLQDVNGGTCMFQALENLLAQESEQELGVIIITDAAPYGGAEGTAKAIVALNEKRKSPAVIGVIAIEPAEADEALGKELSKTGGGYMKITTPKDF